MLNGCRLFQISPCQFRATLPRAFLEASLDPHSSLLYLRIDGTNPPKSNTIPTYFMECRPLLP